MSLFKSKCSKSKLLNTKKIAEHSKVFCFKFTDISRQERHAVTVSYEDEFKYEDELKYEGDLKYED